MPTSPLAKQHIANNPFYTKPQPRSRMISIYEYTAEIIDTRLETIIKGLCPNLYDVEDLDMVISKYKDKPYHYAVVLRGGARRLQFLIDISPESLWNMCVSFCANIDANHIIKVHGTFNDYLLTPDGQHCSDLIWDAIISNMWNDDAHLSDTFIAAMLHYIVAYKLHIYRKYPKQAQLDFKESQPIAL